MLVGLEVQGQNLEQINQVQRTVTANITNLIKLLGAQCARRQMLYKMQPVEYSWPLPIKVQLENNCATIVSCNASSLDA